MKKRTENTNNVIYNIFLEQRKLGILYFRVSDVVYYYLFVIGMNNTTAEAKSRYSIHYTHIKYVKIYESLGTW